MTLTKGPVMLNFHLHHGDVSDVYASWPVPEIIISDGPYGVGGYPGDPSHPKGLDQWYEPHVKAWADSSAANTSLWFWNTEVGWATVHPIMERYGWYYNGLCIWNKGIGHIAGNVNTGTIRSIPVVTLSKGEWESLRHRFHFKAEYGVTNVWDTPAVRGAERVKLKGKAVHPNQKPLSLMERIIRVTSNAGSTLWEPFGGLCSASVAGTLLGRDCYAAEINPKYYEAAKARMIQEGSFTR